MVLSLEKATKKPAQLEFVSFNDERARAFLCRGGRTTCTEMHYLQVLLTLAKLQLNVTLHGLSHRPTFSSNLRFAKNNDAATTSKIFSSTRHKRVSALQGIWAFSQASNARDRVA